jgi:hypothetical protein
MFNKDGISIHQIVENLAMVSFYNMDGNKKVAISSFLQ